MQVLKSKKDNQKLFQDLFPLNQLFLNCRNTLSRWETSEESPDSSERRTGEQPGSDLSETESATENNRPPWWVRVKKGGKSSRQSLVILIVGKPCVLKCHIGRGKLCLESDSLSLYEASMGRQLDPFW